MKVLVLYKARPVLHSASVHLEPTHSKHAGTETHNPLPSIFFVLQTECERKIHLTDLRLRPVDRRCGRQQRVPGLPQARLPGSSLPEDLRSCEQILVNK